MWAKLSTKVRRNPGTAIEMSLDGRTPSPLAVGVVGHRDLPADDLPHIRTGVAAFLEDLLRAFPGVRLEVISGLAEGADLLVSNLAASRGIRVRAVLPMRMDMYRSDFSPAALREVERLISSPGVDVVELSPPAKVDLERAREAGLDRDRLYVALGDHVAAGSHLLLALWDGVANGEPGGTADVVLGYLGANSPGGPYVGPIRFEDPAPDDTADGNVVAWLPVRRSGRGTRPDAPIAYLTAGSAPGTLVRWPTLPWAVTGRLLRPGEDSQEGRVPGDGGIAPSRSLIGDLRLALGGDLPQRLAGIDAQYLRADATAVASQRRSTLVFKALAAIAALMGLLFLLFAKVQPLRAFLIGYLVLMAASVAVYVLARRRRWFSMHLAHRVAAETLRVRFYLALAGIEDRVDVGRLLDLTGIARLDGFAWIRRDSPPGASSSVDGGDPDVAERLDAVRSLWIEDQARYFRSRAANLTHRHHRLKRLRSGLFAAAFLAAVGLLFFSGELEEIELATDLDAKTLVIVLMGLLPLWLGIWEIYQDKMATRELIWQYRNQAEHFTKAAEALARASSPAQRGAILADLGQRSLFEVYLWSLHRFHREFEASLPG